MTDVQANLNEVRERIALAARRAGRSPDDVRLVVVTKTMPVERITEAVRAGATDFGENRMQEAEAKYTARGMADESRVSREGITLHMIGTLQRNKVRHAVALFDWVQSVDRVELAADLDRLVGRVRPGETLPVLLEVNVSGEASKSGVAPADLQKLADAVAECSHLRGSGLMTVARLGASEAELRDTFGTLRSLLENVRRTTPGDWRHLSMGMTDDYECAIEEGSTIIRLGRAIFGARGVK